MYIIILQNQVLRCSNLMKKNSYSFNELINCGILVTVYSGKNIPIKEARNLWERKVTSVFVDDPTDYLEYF